MEKFLKRNKWTSWLILQVISLLVASASLYYLVDNPQILRDSNLHLWSFTLFAGAASYYLVLYLYRSNSYYSELQKKQIELMESKSRLSVTLDSIGDGVISTDTTGKITYMNPVAEMLTGWKHDEVLGRDHTEILQIVNECFRNIVESPILKALEQKEIV